VFAGTKKILLVLLAGVVWHTVAAQTRLITGTVMDSLSHLPIANVSVSTPNGRRGVLTDAKGNFSFPSGKSVQNLVFSAMGYGSLSVSVGDRKGEPVLVYLTKTFELLQDVVVRRKLKYHNKNNPAVELIRKVIANKGMNGPGADAYDSYRQYEKTRLLLDNIPRLLINNFLLKKYSFIFDNKDTTLLPGKSLVPIYIEEVSSEKYYRKHPKDEKKMVLGHKSVDYGEFLDMKGISAVINRLYEDINIYDNTIDAFTMQFMSPIADIAPTFYMYFIRDTVVEDGVKLIHLDFQPRNPEDLLFRGTLYITLDGNYAIRKADLGVAKHVNLNYVREFRCSQDFEKGPGDRYHLKTSDMIALFSPFRRSSGVVGERIVKVDRFSNGQVADSLFGGPAIDSSRQVEAKPDTFWMESRPVALSGNEAKTYTNTDSLLHMKSYHRLMDYATAFTAGYKSAGPFDVGPIGSFYTFDPPEGQRLKFGARTTTRLNTRYYGESYVAYGTRDNRWKYFGSATYAFNNKSIYTFPLHYLQVSYMNDARILGQENAFAVANNFFTSFSHGDNRKWLYSHLARLSYVHEFSSHFSYTLGMKYWQQSPTDSLHYIYKLMADRLDTVSALTTGELSASIRWAPHETFLQSKAGRANVVNRYPIITMQYAKGIKGLFGGQFNYDALHLNIYKRVYISPIGFSDVTFDAGWLGGNLPFPLLVIHPANPSYFYTENAYNLMNVGEFVSDHYAALNIDHFFDGFFFNKIPGFKRLRLREVIAGKILYGGLRDENNPAINPNQMKFPLNNGVLSTYSLGSKPYVEASVGIYNIFTIFRVDVVKRFTYLDHPNVSGVGVRISSNFNF
jgi:Family of unknown function (DUF5686)/CarboxypepD_reg-like domain